MNSSVPPTLRLACPLCDAASKQRLEVNGYPIRECDACGHRFAGVIPAENHVEQVFGDEYFFAGGEGYADYLKSEKLLRAHGRKLSRILSRYMRPGKMLDAGCAAGFVLQGFQAAGWEAEGLEPNSRMASAARQNTNATIYNDPLETCNQLGTYDLIAYLQVIGHLEDPKTTLAKSLSHLKPGGHCLVETWNRDSWTARVFRSRWHEYSPPSVLHWFGFERLISLFTELGYRKVAGGRLTKWISGQHGKSLLRDKLPKIPGGSSLLHMAEWIPDDLACPYFSDDLGWLLFELP